MIFVVIWMKQTLIWFNLQKDGNGNIFSYNKVTFAEILPLQMSLLHQSMCIFKTDLSSYVMAGQNIKKKYMMYQFPINILKQHAILNSSLQNLKVYSSKWCRKTSQKWILCSLHSNSKIQKIPLQIMVFCFDRWILLLLPLKNITQNIKR